MAAKFLKTHQTEIIHKSQFLLGELVWKYYEISFPCSFPVIQYSLFDSGQLLIIVLLLVVKRLKMYLAFWKILASLGLFA